MINKIIFILGYATIVASLVTMTYIFVNAYHSGYETLVTINDYGEAKIELIWMIIGVPCSIYILMKMFCAAREGEYGF